MKIFGLICSVMMIILSHIINGPFSLIMAILGPLLYTVFLIGNQRDYTLSKLVEQGIATYVCDPKTGETEVVWTNKTLPGQSVYLG